LRDLLDSVGGGEVGQYRPHVAGHALLVGAGELLAVGGVPLNRLANDLSVGQVAQVLGLDRLDPFPDVCLPTVVPVDKHAVSGDDDRR
jgi:hypothetical protein